MQAKWKGPNPGKGSRRKSAQKKRREAEEESRRRREERLRRKGEGSSAREGGVDVEANLAHKADASTMREGEADADTALERYDGRLAAFRTQRGALGAFEHAAWWWVHNCVAHPALGVFPGALTVRFHDWTSARLNLRSAPSPSTPPVIEHRWRWLWHNCVAHPLIGIFPTRALFDHHDESAEHMEVEGWV